MEEKDGWGVAVWLWKQLFSFLFGGALRWPSGSNFPSQISLVMSSP
jgi:hypothetical protein